MLSTTDTSRRRRSASLGLRWLVCSCALQLVTVRAHAQGQPQAQLTTVVLCDPNDPALSARVDGQVGDLALRLVVVQTERGRAMDAVQARALAVSHAARASVWLVALPDGGYDISVLDVVSGALQMRQVPAAHKGELLASSATYEAVALLVRAELRALLAVSAVGQAQGEPRAAAVSGRDSRSGADDAAGSPAASSAETARQAETLGVDRSVDRSKEEPSSATGATPDAEREASRATMADAASASDAARAQALRSWAAAGWQLSAPSTHYLANGIDAQLGVQLQRWRFGAAVTLGLPTTLSDSRSVVRLQRQTFALSGAFRVLQHGRCVVWLRALAEVMRFGRQTHVRDPALQATPDADLMSAALAADIALDLRLWRALGLELSLGLDLVPWAPRLSYQIGAQREERAQLGFVQPRASLGVLLGF